MPHSIITRQKEYIHIRVDGLFSVQDSLDLQALAAEAWSQGMPSQVLIEMGNFQGWSHEPDWENLSLMPDRYHQFSRLAIVGNEKWRDDVHMFTCQPLDSEVLRFFSTSQLDEARVWLAVQYLTMLDEKGS